MRIWIVVLWLAPEIQADAEDRSAAPSLTVRYVAPKHAGVIGAPADHIATIRRLIARIDVQLPHPVTVAYRECGTANAFYLADSHTIEICHELWDERRQLYVASGHDREAVERRLREAMTYTLFHEFGHALHHQRELPLLGRIEDAVDEIATIAMIRAGLGDLAATAAYGHDLRSHQPGYAHAPWDGHGNGGQRGFAIACLLYGNDHDRHGWLAERIKAPALRWAECIRDYPKRVTAWRRLLGVT